MLEHFLYNVHFEVRWTKVYSESTKNDVDGLFEPTNISQEVKELVVSNNIDLFGRAHLEYDRKPLFWNECILHLIRVWTIFDLFEISLLGVIAFAFPKCYLWKNVVVKTYKVLHDINSCIEENTSLTCL